MSITATVENDTIKLPAGIHLPDGATVQIEVQGSPENESGRATKADYEAWKRRADAIPKSGLTTDEIMKLMRGEE